MTKTYYTLMLLFVVTRHAKLVTHARWLERKLSLPLWGNLQRVGYARCAPSDMHSQTDSSKAKTTRIDWLVSRFHRQRRWRRWWWLQLRWVSLLVAEWSRVALVCNCNRHCHFQFRWLPPRVFRGTLDTAHSSLRFAVYATRSDSIPSHPIPSDPIRSRR